MYQPQAPTQQHKPLCVSVRVELGTPQVWIRARKSYCGQWQAQQLHKQGLIKTQKLAWTPCGGPKKECLYEKIIMLFKIINQLIITFQHVSRFSIPQATMTIDNQRQKWIIIIQERDENTHLLFDKEVLFLLLFFWVLLLFLLLLLLHLGHHHSSSGIHSSGGSQQSTWVATPQPPELLLWPQITIASPLSWAPQTWHATTSLLLPSSIVASWLISSTRFTMFLKDFSAQLWVLNWTCLSRE